MTSGGFHSFKIRPHFYFLFFKFGCGWSHVAAAGSWFALLSQRFSALLSSCPAVFLLVEVCIFCNHITSQSLKNWTQKILWASHRKVAFWIIFTVLLHPLYSFSPSTSECRQKYWAVLQMQHLLPAPCCIVFPSSASWRVPQLCLLTHPQATWVYGWPAALCSCGSDWSGGLCRPGAVPLRFSILTEIR